jgi:hypothetical protein
LRQKYETLMNQSCATALKATPTIPAADASSFMNAYQNSAGPSSEAAVLAAAQKILSATAVATFLELPDSFTAGGLDAALVTCAVLYQGTPTALAAFAAISAANEALVTQLLQNALLMRDMLVAGGAAGSPDRKSGGVPKYGEAMSIYTQILKANEQSLAAADAAAESAGTVWDDRSPANVLRRLAIGTAVGLAAPMSHRYARDLPNASALVDPVARYQYFERAYKAGELDPAFPVLTAFELSHVIESDATNEDMDWLRTSLSNYHPDLIASEYRWRYASTVHEVAYGDSQCSKFPGVCNGHYSDIPVGGDVCGGRAFWTRFAVKGFGMPTWGATEHAHG